MSLAASGPDWALFLGRLHPLVVHLPIGLLMAVLLCECFALFQRPEPGSPIKVSLLRRALVLITAGAAIGASVVGWLLASEGGYAKDLLFWHRWGGIAFAAVLSSGAVLIWTRAWRSLPLRSGLLLTALGLMTVVGHMGGSMTHGETYLSRYAPAWLQPILGGAPANTSNQVIASEGMSSDAQIVLTMLADHCVECHGPSKQKGKLRLDTPDGLASTVTPGAPGLSELFSRITLARGDEELMPPDSDPLDDELILATMRWIRAGANLETFEKRHEAQVGEQEALALRLDKVRAATDAVITAIPAETAATYAIDLSMGEAPLDAPALDALRPIAGRITELSLAGRRITQVPHDLDLPALSRLSLQRCDIHRDQLAALLKSAPNLQSLNLHSTDADDALLPAIAGLSALRELVIYDTPLSIADLGPLRAANPGLTIRMGESLRQAFAGSGPRLILAADYSKGIIALMREVALGRPEVLWRYEIDDIHDLHLLPNGNVLFQTSWTELIEINPRTGETVWFYDAASMNRDNPGQRVEVHAFERLPGGHTMIAESGPARIIEVDRYGNLAHVINLKVDHPDPHHDTRLVRATGAGTYLVAHEKDGVVREYDRNGEIVWEYDVPTSWTDPATGQTRAGDGDQLFAAVRLGSGNTLIGAGNGRSVLEVSPGGEIVWSVSGDELEGVRLAWVTTVQALSNGNLVIGNCHAGEDQPQIIEIDRDKNIIWKFHDFERFGNALSNSFVTEDPHGFAYTQ